MLWNALAICKRSTHVTAFVVRVQHQHTQKVNPISCDNIVIVCCACRYLHAQWLSQRLEGGARALAKVVLPWLCRKEVSAELVEALEKVIMEYPTLFDDPM